jgi:hypothetical protein
VSFGNPLGWVALFGIPAVVLIHLLRVRSRRVRVSTLFLLEPGAVTREGGRKLESLRSSPLLWLQIVAVVAATWLLVEPRWLREDSTLNVVLVVDGSASMSAYRDAAAAALESYLPVIERGAERVVWTVLGSDPTAPTLYSGEARDAATAAALGWQSFLGVHELGESSSVASSIAGPRGLVVMLTDHVPDVPAIQAGIEVLAVGTPLANVGVVSVAVDDDGGWSAIVKNSGTTPEHRSWWVEADGAASEPNTLELAPGQVRFIAGETPAGAEEMAVVVAGDRFALDDRLPFVVPKSKTLRVYVSPALENDRFVLGLVETLEPVERVSSVSAADLAIGEPGPKASIVFAESAPGALEGPIVVERDALVEGLDFRGLVAAKATPRDHRDGDRVLLWQGEHPLLVVRESMRERTLFVGFPLSKSNAERIPAFVLALHRFGVQAREQKRAFSRNNVETRQWLRVVPAVEERAPEVPGFFEIRSDGEVLFKGAAHFADVREGDLSAASSSPPSGGIVRDVMLSNSLPDPFASIWILLLMGLAATAWAFQEKGA